MEKVTVYGAGYVGLVTAACLADLGHEVVCVDVDPMRIVDLQKGQVPIYEPGLTQIIERNSKRFSKHLSFTTEFDPAIAHGDYHFIAVGTPPLPDGAADLRAVFDVIHAILQKIKRAAVLVNKSTVPVGTGLQIKKYIDGGNTQVNIVSNPEFLREGQAVSDFMHPDRIIVGAEQESAFEKMAQLYQPLIRNGVPFVTMDITSAELTKYASNAFLATKISFMNELSHFAEHVGADVEQVRRGMGYDPRIGPHFLQAGVGYGGSCFPKDVQALCKSAEVMGLPLTLLHAVTQINQRQKRVILEKVMTYFGGTLQNKTIAVWGLAFKPETDDMREAVSLEVVPNLCHAGAHIQAYDPVAMPHALPLFEGLPVTFTGSPEEALEGADLLVILTEWSVFKEIDLTTVRARLKQPVIVDGRNLYDLETMRKAGFLYFSIGRPVIRGGEMR